MTVGGIGFEAEEAHPTSRAHDFSEIFERILRLGRRHVREKDPAHFRVMTGARGRASFGGRSQRAKMQIVDACMGDVRGELRFREAGPARAGDRANVREQLNASAPSARRKLSGVAP